MSLTDIMSFMELHVYAEVGLIIFLIAFLAIAVRALTSSRSLNDRMAAMPLANDTHPQEGSNDGD